MPDGPQHDDATAACPFCFPPPEKIAFEHRLVRALWDAYPGRTVTDGRGVSRAVAIAARSSSLASNQVATWRLGMISGWPGGRAGSLRRPSAGGGGRSTPILAEIDELRQKLQADVLPKSPLGDALRYLDNQWAPLQRFVEDGRLAIDNNRAENQLRIVAVGRKNWLFAGSLEGARWTAILYSLVQSCRLVDVDPFLYFRDVLRRLPTHSHRLIAQLTPRGWAEIFAPAASV